MTKSIWIVLCVIWVVTILHSVGGEHQQEPLNGWLKYYEEVAESYDIRLKTMPDESLVLIPKPVQVYSNPSSGRDTHGAFFIWTNKGRAEVIASIWSRLSSDSPDSERLLNHEFHSLSTEPLTAIRKNHTDWAPKEGGIEFKPIPNGPPPSDSPRQRLSQMKAMVQQFSGFTLYPRNGSEPSEQKMRILPTPLYRYSIDKVDSPVIDGAVFGMFVNWDPEIILVVEDRVTPNGNEWQYGVAHLDNKPLWLQHNGIQVWTKKETSLGSSVSNYYARIGVEKLPNVRK